MILKDKKALITGGSQGIGKAAALKLASEGADIAIIHMGSEEWIFLSTAQALQETALLL